MKRPEFLSHSLAGGTGMLLMPSMLITNVLQNQMKQDHRKTMTLLAEMGYKYLEFGGTYDETPSELKNELECVRSSINYLNSLKF